jgi:hypothetical protein
MPQTPPFLMIGTPCFGGQVSTIYAFSLLQLQQACARRGVNLGYLMQAGDALITRARQTIVTHFLSETQGTHLLFIDSDIGFEPEQVFRLLDFDADFTGAAYPVKAIDWSQIPAAVQAGRTPLESATLSYVVEGELSNGLISRQGFVKARYAGTGFLMIRRAALESMIEHYPKLRYRSEHKANDPFEGNPWRSALFNCMIDPETSTYLSEDFSFCRRWTSMGGEIWVDLTSKLDHVGSMVFRGNLAARVDLPREPEEPAKPEPPDDSAGH